MNRDNLIQYEFVIEMPIIVYLQPEELESCKEELAERLAHHRRSGFSTTGLNLPRIVLERAMETANDALHVGVTQHEGALIVVESRRPIAGT